MAKKPVLSAKALAETERAELYTALDRWHKTATKAAELSAQEMEMRKAITERWFKDCGEGTNNMILDYGKVLKADIKINRKVDEAQLDALKSKAHSTGQTSLLVAIESLFAYKPSLRVGEWKELDPKERKKFADIITESPGAPSLKIETAPTR